MQHPTHDVGEGRAHVAHRLRERPTIFTAWAKRVVGMLVTLNIKDVEDFARHDGLILLGE